jgi:MFS family permease
MNKNIIALGFVSFFTDMASNMVTTILPIYVVFSLHNGVDKLGYILAIATMVSYGFRFLFGYLSDKYQIVKPFVVIGYLISAVTKPLLYFTSSWEGIAALRGVERMGKAFRSATKDRLISEFSEKKSGKTFGFHKMMDIAGEMVGAIIVFLVLFFIGKNIEVFKSIFAWTLLPGILAVVIVIFFVDDVPYKQTDNKKFSLSEDKKLLPLLFIYFGFLFFMFSDSFFIIKAKEIIKVEYIPLMVILLTFTQTITSYLFGIWIDKVGAIKIMILSFIFAFLSMGFLYFKLIILAFIFLGLFLVASLNGIRSYISDNAVNKGSVYGILYGGVALFSSLGAIVIGEIWQKFGDNYAIIFSLVGVSFMSFILIILKGKIR